MKAMKSTIKMPWVLADVTATFLHHCREDFILWIMDFGYSRKAAKAMAEKIRIGLTQAFLRKE